MKKDGWSVLLIAGTLVPLVMLLWPFAWWGSIMQLILRVIPAVCVQLLLCRWDGCKTVKWIPLLVTGAAALWGMWLYFTSPHWGNATWIGLMCDYGSPCLSCAAVLAVDGAVRYRKRLRK